MAQVKNVDNIDEQELKERERRLKNIVIRGIQEEKTETPTSLGHVIGEFFNKYYGMNIFGAHRVGKQGVSCSGERPTVCTMLDETKRRIILQNSWVYLKGTKFFVCEYHTISQQNGNRKAYEERRKIKIKEGLKDGETHKASEGLLEQ